jgi:Uma2 family endonuclease
MLSPDTRLADETEPLDGAVCAERGALSFREMAAARTKLATAADLRALPEPVRAEIIHGMIVEKASPSGEHGGAQLSFGATLRRRFQRQPGGRWPGGWWFGSEVEIQYETHEVYLHDVAGWRRDRVPDRPAGRPIRSRPDWACELLSPSNAKRDLVDKFQVLHTNGVPFYWIADPVEQTLIVHRWEPRGYLVTLTAAAGDVVRAEPFEAVELRISTLFGIEDDEE